MNFSSESFKMEKFKDIYQKLLPPKIFACIDIHCEIQAVSFAELSKMKPGEPSAAIRERVIKVARTIADLEGSEKIQSMHIGEAIGYRNLDRGDWAERNLTFYDEGMTYSKNTPDFLPHT
jgi:magnesium chelatase family protein